MMILVLADVTVASSNRDLRLDEAKSSRIMKEAG